jgi:hypothetical protein
LGWATFWAIFNKLIWLPWNGSGPAEEWWKNQTGQTFKHSLEFGSLDPRRSVSQNKFFNHVGMYLHRNFHNCVHFSAKDGIFLEKNVYACLWIILSV